MTTTPEELAAEAFPLDGSEPDAIFEARRRMAAVLRAHGLLVDAPAAGWSTADRRAAETQAKLRWPIDKAHTWETERDQIIFQQGCINGFILGAEWQSSVAAGVAPQEPRDRLDWKRRAETLLRKWMAAEERAQVLFEKYAEHAEHVQVEAWSTACIDGDCEHRDGFGEPEDLSKCPSSPMDVCVDCMEIAGVGRDPEGWEERLCPWPCERAKPDPSPDREEVARAAAEKAWDEGEAAGYEDALSEQRGIGPHEYSRNPYRRTENTEHSTPG